LERADDRVCELQEKATRFEKLHDEADRWEIITFQVDDMYPNLY
jgi:hypothetical protein